MITFLPYADFHKCAACLDWRRLGKQRVEAWQLLTGLYNESGIIKTPLGRMWRGHEYFLGMYYNEMLAEWARRGYKNELLFQINLNVALASFKRVFPPWLNDERLHYSHRANLIRKDRQWYEQFGPEWQILPQEGYWWP